MGSFNAIVPVRDQGHLSREMTESSETPDLFRDNELRQNNPPDASVTLPLPISSSSGDLQYLDDYSNAPWLPICVAIPFLSILVATIFLFALFFNLYKSLEPQWSLYEIWISQFDLIYLLLISYPCACATAIRFGLAMDLGNRWKRFSFFWLCLTLYGAHLFLVLFFSLSGWVKAARCAGLIVTLALYISYTIFLLITL